MNTGRSLFAGLLVGLASCMASGPQLSSIQSGFPRLADDRGRVYFYRTKTAFGAAMHARILIDGEMVGRSIPGGVFYIDVPAGKHAISIPVEGFVHDKFTSNLSVSVSQGEMIYVRTWIGGSGFGGRTNIEVAASEDAAQVIRDLSYTGGETVRPTE